MGKIEVGFLGFGRKKGLVFRELQLLETVFQIRPETTIPPYAPVLRITSKSRQVGQPQLNRGERQHRLHQINWLGAAPSGTPWKKKHSHSPTCSSAQSSLTCSHEGQRCQQCLICWVRARQLRSHLKNQQVGPYSEAC